MSETAPTFGAQAPSQDASTPREGAEGACEASPKPTEPTPTRGHPMTTAPEPMGHDAALKALTGCARTVTVLSYEEVINGYFRLRGWTNRAALLARLDAAEAEVRRMREGLEPFAKAADGWHDDEPDSTVIDSVFDEDGNLTLGDLRVARAALKEGGS